MVFYNDLSKRQTILEDSLCSTKCYIIETKGEMYITVTIALQCIYTDIITENNLNRNKV